jgi:hypothetical protein
MALTIETTSPQVDSLRDLLDRFRLVSPEGRLNYSELGTAEIEELLRLVSRAIPL